MDQNRSIIALVAAALVGLLLFLAFIPWVFRGMAPIEESPRAAPIDPDLLQDDLERDPSVLPTLPPPRRAREPDYPVEDWVPRTRQEGAWRDAWQKVVEEEREMAGRQRSFDAWQGFMESPLGGNVSSAFELVRRGHGEAAADLMEKSLDEILAQPFEVQAPLLKGAVRIFKAGGKRESLAKALLAYLEGLKKKLEAGGFAGREDQGRKDMLSEVDAALVEVRRHGAGSER